MRRLAGSTEACLALLTLLCAPGLHAQAGPTRSPPGEVTGTVTLDGCRSAEVAVTLRAEPLMIATGADAAVERGLSRTVLVSAVPTGERTLAFRLAGLADGRLYRIGIRARTLGPGDAGSADSAPNPCDTIVWEGLPSSTAVAGGDLVQVRGRAVNGQLRVLANERRYGARGWSRAGVFRLDSADGARVALRWLPPPGSARGVLQVSLERFDRDLGAGACRSPAGLLHSAEVDVGARELGVDPVYELPAVQLDELIVPPSASGDGAATVTEAEYAKILLGKPLYVRVVPVDENDPEGALRCDRERDGLPSWVLLVLADALGEPPAEPPAADELTLSSPVIYRGPVVYGYPNYNHMCMRSTKGHKLSFWAPMDIAVINNTSYGHGDWFPANQRFCWKTGDSGGFDPIGTITEVAGGVLSPLEWLVDSVAGAWESLKTFAVNAVASGIDELGIECGTSCKSVLRGGLEIGLAAAGIPPTLPNFDQLKQQGLDYVASQIASQTGLPSEVTSWAVNHGYKAMAAQFTDEISDARGYSSGMPGVDWAAWDNGIEPATLEFTLHRTAVGKLSTGLYLPANAVYDHRHVGVPRVMLDEDGQPGASSVNLNVALSPNLSGWQQPAAKTFSIAGQTVTLEPTAEEVAGSMKGYWKTRIQQNPCVPMSINREVWILLPVPAGTLATYPSVPVMMNSKPYHAPLALFSGQPACYLAVTTP